MLNKSICDCPATVRAFLKDNGIVDYDKLKPGEKVNIEARMGGKAVVVLDRAFLYRGTDQEQSIAVEDLPPISIKGGAFAWDELALALRSMTLSKPSKPASAD